MFKVAKAFGFDDTEDLKRELKVKYAFKKNWGALVFRRSQKRIEGITTMNTLGGSAYIGRSQKRIEGMQNLSPSINNGTIRRSQKRIEGGVFGTRPLPGRVLKISKEN